MNDLTLREDHPLRVITGMTAAELEIFSLKQEQVECGVTHHFGPGVCIRAVTIPGDTVAVGHHQNFAHMNIMLEGRCSMISDSGAVSHFTAPAIFVGQPGRKCGYVFETVVWLNVYQTDLKTAEEVEAHFVTKSDEWKANDAFSRTLKSLERQKDRDDYAALLEETGLSEALARAQSEDLSDQIEFGNFLVMVAESPIEGKGLFATADIKAGETIGPGRLGGKRTQAGRYTNHAKAPNAQMVSSPNGDIYLVANAPIAGCKGGQLGDEITVDYRRTLAAYLEH